MLNEKASPQHTLAYVRNSLIEEQCKIYRSELCKNKKIAYGRGNFVLNEKASPQHTLAYVRNSLIEEQCKIHRSERFFRRRVLLRQIPNAAAMVRRYNPNLALHHGQSRAGRSSRYYELQHLPASRYSSKS